MARRTNKPAKQPNTPSLTEEAVKGGPEVPPTNTAAPVDPAEKADAGSAAFLSPAPLPVTRDTPFRASGDVPLATWEREFKGAGSRIAGAQLRAMYDAAKGVSALMLNQLRVESWFGAGNLPARNNVLGVREPTSLAFMAFSAPVDCVREIIRRWTDPTYKNGVYQPQNLSLAGMLAKYSPPHENDTEGLIRGAVDRINGWRGEAETSTDPGPNPSADPWRPYPYPAMLDLIVSKPYDGAGFDRVAPRGPRIVGSCNHITDGRGSIEWYAAFFSTGGERARDALVDTVIGRDGRIGLLNDWRDPNRGGTRAGWANGTANGLEGDGLAFYRRYPLINDVLVSKEHENPAGKPLTDAQLASSIEISTANAQAVRCPWNTYPYHPGFGGVNIEQMHFWFAPKSCPAEPFISTYYPILVREVRAKLRAWQGGVESGPAPEPEPIWYTRFGFDAAQIADFFGVMSRHNADGSVDDLPFDPKGPLSLLWLERCDREGIFPEAERIWSGDAKFVDGEERYASWEGGWTAFLPLADSRASWSWLDEAAA